MTPRVQLLLVLNIVIHVATVAMPALRAELAFVPALVLRQPWTMITYAFVHANLWHLLFNMLMLFFFGPRLEERLGSRVFLAFYLLCGVGGAVLSFFIAPGAAVVGASGAIFGVVVGFARYWPREEIYIWGILPIQARMLAILMVIFSLVAGVTGAQDGIAHAAHLGGLVVGFLFLRRWERQRHRRIVKHRSRPRVPLEVVEADALRRWEKTIPRDQLHEINLEEVDQLLQKARKSGARTLTRDERAFLDRMSKLKIDPAANPG